MSWRHLPPLRMPDERTLEQLPEAALICLLDTTLSAVEMALRAEHPPVEQLPFDPTHEIVPSLLLAHLIISHAQQLRQSLRLYDAAVRRAVGWQREAVEDIF